MVVVQEFDQQVVDILHRGGLAVIRTDTLYGVVAAAKNQAAVAKVFAAKGRDADKAPIVLVASPRDMFDPLSAEQQAFADTVWPGKVSVIFDAPQAPDWLRHADGSLAYRVPPDSSLRALLKITGPLIAPSANPQGQPPAATAQQAIDYFGDSIDIYVDGGEVGEASPSRLLRFHADGTVEQLR